MKKKMRKLTLNRETLLRLEFASLVRVGGAAKAPATDICDTFECPAESVGWCQSISCLGGVQCNTGGFTVCC